MIIHDFVNIGDGAESHERMDDISVGFMANNNNNTSMYKYLPFWK